MKTTRIIFLFSLLLTLAACNGGDSGGGQAASPKSTPVPGSTLTPEPEQPAVEDVTVTYYSLSRTEAPIAGWTQKTYTATGYCAEIQEKTFCWSDGLKTLTWVSNNITFGPYRANYFMIATSNGKPNPCDGGCSDDYMQNPREITTYLLQYIAQEKIQEVFDYGTENQMSCILTQGTMTCGDLVFTGLQ